MSCKEQSECVSRMFRMTCSWCESEAWDEPEMVLRIAAAVNEYAGEIKNLNKSVVVLM